MVNSCHDCIAGGAPLLPRYGLPLNATDPMSVIRHQYPCWEQANLKETIPRGRQIKSIPLQVPCISVNPILRFTNLKDGHSKTRLSVRYRTEIAAVL